MCEPSCHRELNHSVYHKSPALAWRSRRLPLIAHLGVEWSHKFTASTTRVAIWCHGMGFVVCCICLMKTSNSDQWPITTTYATYATTYSLKMQYSIQSYKELILDNMIMLLPLSDVTRVEFCLCKHNYYCRSACKMRKIFVAPKQSHNRKNTHVHI